MRYIFTLNHYFIQFYLLIWKKILQKDEEYDIRMLIHQSLAGCVIGKGGSKIKEIRDVSLNF